MGGSWPGGHSSASEGHSWEMLGFLVPLATGRTAAGLAGQEFCPSRARLLSSRSHAASSGAGLGPGLSISLRKPRWAGLENCLGLESDAAGPASAVSAGFLLGAEGLFLGAPGPPGAGTVPELASQPATHKWIVLRSPEMPGSASDFVFVHTGYRSSPPAHLRATPATISSSRWTAAPRPSAAACSRPTVGVGW